MAKLFPRSFFYTPAINKKNIFLAAELTADVAVLDLEDSVPEIKKENARNVLVNFLAKTDFSPIKAIRINCIRNKHGIDDLHFLLGLKYCPDIIVMTMTNDAEEVAIMKDLFRDRFPKLKIYVTIETGLAINKISSIASIADGLIFGSADYAALLGVDISWENMLFARYQIVSNAAAYNIPAIDTACYNFNPENILIEESQLARSLGFTGKAAVHPSQVKIINELFSSSEQEISFAKRVIKEFDENKHRIKNVDGQMIGPPFVAKAKKILARSFDEL